MILGDTAAHHLTGLELDDGWRVLNRVELPEDHTGSAYSVGYLATQARTSMMGFLKAFDYSEALEDADPARALGDLAASYNAERDLLEMCGRRGLRRIVRALSAGTVRVTGYTPSAVSYLIFELAEGDARDLRSVTDFSDHIPILRLAHHAAVALSQLHSIGAAHQDIKPSNLLYWGTPQIPEGKLGDLGCAHLDGRPTPRDGLPVAGDCSYAAPEQLYRAFDLLAEHRRKATDVYMLGNLLMFLLTTISHSALMYAQMDQSLHWKQWGGTFEDALPALLDSHGMVLGRLESVLHADIRDDALLLIDELCHPDPRLRGERMSRRNIYNPFRLERIITRLDLLLRRATIAGYGRR